MTGPPLPLGPRRWLSLGEWTIAFGLLTLAILGAMTIGMLILPFAIGALAFAARRNRGWPESTMGALLGIGTVLLAIAYGNRDYSPCPGRIRLAPGEYFRCGGRDPVPWLVIGLVLVVAGSVGYWAWRRVQRSGAAT